MSRRKPRKRLAAARSSDNDKRRLRDPVPPKAWLDTLAGRATFQGYSKHKLDPRAFGLVPFTGSREDATYCDGHAQFTPRDVARVPSLLERGISAGLVGHNDDANGDPTILWTVDDNGWIYETRITIPGQAVYHGYPVLGTEAIARLVLARYVQHVYDTKNIALFPSVQQLQERYS
jgi:hypothetical protein